MNQRLVLGSQKKGLNDRIWVFAAAKLPVGSRAIADIEEKGQFTLMHRPNLAVRRIRATILVGLGVGAIIEALAVLAAMMSGGAGHGSYVAARMLFPFSMLLTLIEGSIGLIAMFAGLMQFPLYGALIGRAVASKTPTFFFLLAATHLVAVFACFSGPLPSFS